MLYESERGRIGAGLVCDHICRVPSCVNPTHIDLVTPAENTRRMHVARAASPNAPRIQIGDRRSFNFKPHPKICGKKFCAECARMRLARRARRAGA